MVRFLLAAYSRAADAEGEPLRDDTAMHGLAGVLFDALPIGAFIHGPAFVTRANPAASAMLGAHSPEELSGVPVSDLVHPDARDAGEARRVLLFERDQRFPSVPVKLLTRAGDPVTLTVSAASFTHDGTRHGIVVSCPAGACAAPAAAAGCGPAETLEHAALEAFPLPILAVSGGRVAIANAATRALLDHTDDLTGVDAFELLHPDARDAMAERAELLLAMEGRPITIPLKGLKADGSIARGRSIASCFCHEGRHVYVFVMTEDAA